jgi:hypothetical protein
MLRISRDKVCYELSPHLEPVAYVDPGERVVLETHDSRTGRLQRPEDVLTRRQVPSTSGGPSLATRSPSISWTSSWEARATFWQSRESAFSVIRSGRQRPGSFPCPKARPVFPTASPCPSGP